METGGVSGEHASGGLRGLQKGRQAVRASQSQAGKGLAFDPILSADFFLFMRTVKYLS